MPTDHPSEAVTPPHLTLFDATEDQLIDELRRRNTAVVVVRERLAEGSRTALGETVFLIDYRGGVTYALGLLARAQARIVQCLGSVGNNQSDAPDTPEEEEPEPG